MGVVAVADVQQRHVAGLRRVRIDERPGPGVDAVTADQQGAQRRVDTDEDEVAELFDKYNLRALPVVNSGDKLVGIVEADDVISFLRGRT